MAYTVGKKLLRKPSGNILRDDLILLKTEKSRIQYPGLLRRVEMLVEVETSVITLADAPPVFVSNLLPARIIEELLPVTVGSSHPTS